MSRLVGFVLLVASCGFEHGRLRVDAGVASDGDAIAGDDVLDAPDARGFDPATDCPTSYDISFASSPSRYRLVVTTDVAWPQYALCNQDLPGRTHAIVFDSLQEVVELDNLTDARMTIGRFYAGGVQSPTASARDADWVDFHGDNLISTAWHTPESEPDDGAADLIENQGQQLLIFDRALTFLHDATGVSAYGIVCECDGVAIHPKAQQHFDMDPNNPN